MLKTSGDTGDAGKTRGMLWRQELWQLCVQGSSKLAKSFDYKHATAKA